MYGGCLHYTNFGSWKTLVQKTCEKLKLLQPTQITQIPPNTCLKEKNCVIENRNSENCDSRNPICVFMHNVTV